MKEAASLSKIDFCFSDQNIRYQEVLMINPNPHGYGIKRAFFL
jgi:hypothetical protein